MVHTKLFDVWMHVPSSGKIFRKQNLFLQMLLAQHKVFAASMSAVKHISITSCLKLLDSNFQSLFPNDWTYIKCNHFLCIFEGYLGVYVCAFYLSYQVFEAIRISYLGPKFLAQISIFRIWDAKLYNIYGYSKSSLRHIGTQDGSFFGAAANWLQSHKSNAHRHHFNNQQIMAIKDMEGQASRLWWSIRSAVEIVEEEGISIPEPRTHARDWVRDGVHMPL